MIKKLTIVGELMNNSYARARAAFLERRPEGYAALAALQERLGADYLTLNLDGTQRIQVRREEMIAFLETPVSSCKAWASCLYWLRSSWVAVP